MTAMLLELFHSCIALFLHNDSIDIVSNSFYYISSILRSLILFYTYKLLSFNCFQKFSRRNPPCETFIFNSIQFAPRVCTFSVFRSCFFIWVFVRYLCFNFWVLGNCSKNEIIIHNIRTPVNFVLNLLKIRSLK